MERSVFIHVHIPKCGGTTFIDILGRNLVFDKDRTWDSRFYNRQQVKNIIRRFNSIQAFSSHNFSLDIPFDISEVDLYSIVFVRDPVRRFVSHYFFQRNRKKYYSEKAWEMDLDEYITYALDGNRETFYARGQMYYLLGSVDDPYEEIEAYLNSGRLLLFPVERFDEACIVLETLFPEHFQDCAYVKRNISIKDQRITRHSRKRIENYATHDRGLHKMAHAFLDRKIEEEIPSRRAMTAKRTDFFRRCGKIRKIDTIRKGLLRVYRKIPYF